MLHLFEQRIISVRDLPQLSVTAVSYARPPTPDVATSNDLLVALGGLC